MPHQSSWPQVGPKTLPGPSIETVQHLLRAHGQDIAVDGIYGPQTSGAIQKHQSDHSLGVDGIAGNETWPTLLESVSQGSTGDAVRAAQFQLAGRALPETTGLAVDGNFGPLTNAALVRSSSCCPARACRRRRSTASSARRPGSAWSSASPSPTSDAARDGRALSAVQFGAAARCLTGSSEAPGARRVDCYIPPRSPCTSPASGPAPRSASIVVEGTVADCPVARTEGNVGEFFRAGVGIVLRRRSTGEVLTFERIGLPGAWQYPQGGIEAGEDPLVVRLRFGLVPPQRRRTVGKAAMALWATQLKSATDD